MTVTALDIARKRWKLDREIITIPCGCRWLMKVNREVDRRTFECKRHRPGSKPVAATPGD